MAARPTSAVEENGVASNGNGKNGNGNISVLGVANLASTGVLLLAMFGLWWQTADPRERLKQIEANIVDTRKELNEGLNSVRREMPDRYVTQREHTDLQNRLVSEVEVAHRTHDNLLPKVQFETWKTEHDLYHSNINAVFKDRIDQLYALYRETQKSLHDIEIRSAK